MDWFDPSKIGHSRRASRLVRGNQQDGRRAQANMEVALRLKPPRHSNKTHHHSVIWTATKRNIE
jgi:hypothetical protein